MVAGGDGWKQRRIREQALDGIGRAAAAQARGHSGASTDSAMVVDPEAGDGQAPWEAAEECW